VTHVIQVWDLRRIRQQLADLSLDWDLPPYPPPPSPPAPLPQGEGQGVRGPLRIQVLPAPPLPPSGELDAAAHFERGLLHARLREYPKALSDFNRAGALHPDGKPYTAEAYSLRGLTYASRGQWDRAAADLGQAIELGAAEAEVWFWMGRVHSQSRRWDESIRAYTKAIQLNPAYVDAYHQRGHAHEGMRQWERSVADHSEAVRRKPDDWQPHSCRGRAHAELGRWDQAAADFARATELEGAGELAWYYHALVCLHLGDAGGYRRTCTAMLERFGKTENAAGAYRVAWTCVLAPGAVVDLDQVVRLAEQALSSDPKSYGNLLALGAACYRAGQLEAAVRHLNAAIQAHDQHVMASLFLAMAHHRLGHAEQARHRLDEAVQRLEPVEPQRPNETAAGELSPWYRRLAVELLRREAEALVHGAAADR
jgi:tetratricopeptide (TPR) repeat protein